MKLRPFQAPDSRVTGARPARLAAALPSMPPSSGMSVSRPVAYLPFLLNGSIATLTSLDFLGFGLPDHYPSLGELLAQGKTNMHAPWLGLSGFFTLVITLTLLVFVGEGDPRRSAGVGVVSKDMLK